MENTELKIINEQEILGKDFKIYGDIDNPLFLGKDVAKWIEHNKPSEMISNVDEDEKLKAIVSHSGQNREMWFLTEDGLYEVLMQSRKPIAKSFKKEVKKVLKQIRQTGGYIPIDENMSDMEILSRAVLISQKTIENKNKIIENQKKQLEEQKPMVDFANTIASSSDSIDMGTFAKLVKDEDVFIGGRNKLFEHLRSKGYLMKNNIPYQRYIDNGVFELVEYTYKTPYGERLGSKCLVSGKGQMYLIEKLRKENK